MPGSLRTVLTYAAASTPDISAKMHAGGKQWIDEARCVSHQDVAVAYKLL